MARKEIALQMEEYFLVLLQGHAMLLIAAAQ
jgi:hypothetical protein